jgi:hypothetical protein
MFALGISGGAYWVLLVYWRFKGEEPESIRTLLGELFLLGFVCPLLILLVAVGAYSLGFPLPDGSRWENIPLGVVGGLLLTPFHIFYYEIAERESKRKPRAFELYREYEAEKLRKETAHERRVSIQSGSYGFGAGSIIRLSGHRLISVFDRLVNYVNMDHVKRSKELIEWVNLIFGLSLFSVLAWALTHLRSWIGF